MRIINTDKNSKVKSQNAKLKFKTKNLKFYVVVLTFAFCVFSLTAGCVQPNELEQAQSCVGKSDIYYQHSIERYKKLINKGKDLDRLYFELGRIYFSHGEFEKAIAELKQSNFIQAGKLLAISNYNLGKLADALDIFEKNNINEDEYLYYYGLTCEKLNLFDKALDIYKKIKGNKFLPQAVLRIDTIEKEAGYINIKQTDPGVYKIIQSAPLQDAYPQAGALILYCDEKVEVTKENTQISYLHYIVKILNDRGKEDFSETNIEYDSTYENVELQYARIIKPDGTVVNVGSRHIRDVSKYLNFPLYSNVRVFIISFPEITQGAVIEYKLKVYRNQLVNKKDFVMHYPLQSSEPIISANFEISLPKEKPLKLKILNEKYNDSNAALQPKVQEADNRLIYSWQFKNIPQIIPEANMPAQVEVNPVVLLSTFGSWQDIYQWWWGLSKDKIKADAAIQNKLKELTKGLAGDEEKIKSIYNFCAKEIRYVAVEYGQAGYEPHKAEDIFKNKYGDCKDQSILLVTMLKEAGFLAFPVLISTKDYYNMNADFPAVIFDHCIAAVSIKGKTVFMDPTAQTCSFEDLPGGDQDRQVLLFKEDSYEIKTTPLYPAEHNLVSQKVNIKVYNDESIGVKKDISTYGMYDQAQRFWLLFTPPQLIGERLKEKIQDISIGAKLNDYNIQNLDNLNKPVVLSYTFNGPEYMTMAGNLRIMPQLASADTAIVAKDKRKYAIDFGVLDQKETVFEIELPASFAIKYMPESVTEDSPWLKFSVEYSQNANKLKFRQVVELKKNIISEEDYPAFKAYFDKLAKKIKQRVILEKIK